MVSVRSYSLISGRITLLSEIGTPGISRSTSSAIRRSCAGLAKELMSATVTASTPRSRRYASFGSRSASSSSSTTSPRAPTRSTASTVFSSAASGSGLGQTIHAASPPGTNDLATCSTCR